VSRGLWRPPSRTACYYATVCCWLLFPVAVNYILLTPTNCTPQTLTSTLVPRSFSVSGLTCCNAVPPRLRDPALSLESFCQLFKTAALFSHDWLHGQLLRAPLWQFSVKCCVLKFLLLLLLLLLMLDNNFDWNVVSNQQSFIGQATDQWQDCFNAKIKGAIFLPHSVLHYLTIIKCLSDQCGRNHRPLGGAAFSADGSIRL